MKLLRTVLNGWWLALVIDGGLRVFSGLVAAVTGSQLLDLLVLPFELIAVIGAFIVWLIAAITPRVPLRMVVPPMVVLLWLMLGALPFSVLLYGVGSALQILLGLVLLASVGLGQALGRSAGHAIGFELSALAERPAYGWKRSVGWVGTWFTVVPALIAIYLVTGAAWTVSWGTGDFMRLNTQGLSVAHKTYSLDGQTTHLIGMMHLGEAEVYDTMLSTIPADGNALVLSEGVTDRDGLLTAPRDAYAKAARVVGLSGQGPIGQMTRLPVHNADVDVNTFNPTTIELLNVALGMYDVENLDTALPAYLKFWTENSSRSDEIVTNLFDDILHRRNDHLLREMAAAQPDHARLVVPWGALHLAGIEAALLDDGWTHQTTERVVLVHWATLLGR